MAVASLRALAADPDLRPVGVFTQPAARRSRRGKASHSAVGEAALELGLPLIETPSVNRGEAFEHLTALKPDVIVVVAFGQMLSREVLNLPRHGCLNIHPSALPLYRGAAPVQRAVMDGVRESAISVMRLVREMDAGPILVQEPWPLDESKTAPELLAEAGERGAEIMCATLRRLNEGETIPAMEQDHEQATFAAPLTTDDGLLNFDQPATQVRDCIRAVSGWPRGVAWLDREPAVRVLIHAASVAPESGVAGEVIGINKDGFIVACNEQSILVREAQLENKPRRMGRDVANGLRLEIGEKFQIHG